MVCCLVWLLLRWVRFQNLDFFCCLKLRNRLVYVEIDDTVFLKYWLKRTTVFCLNDSLNELKTASYTTKMLAYLGIFWFNNRCISNLNTSRDISVLLFCTKFDLLMTMKCPKLHILFTVGQNYACPALSACTHLGYWRMFWLLLIFQRKLLYSGDGHSQ